MQQKTDVGAWIKETLSRFSLQSPKFFKVWQTAGMLLLLVTGIPEGLKMLYEDMGIDVWTMLPVAVQVLASKTIALAGFVMKFMAMLPVNNANAIVNNSPKLPFTEKKKSEGVDARVGETIQGLNK